MTVIELPWPSKDLSPNARLHWSKKARAVKKARNDAAWLALEAGIRTHDFTGVERLVVTYVFTPPDRRNRDDDNLIASLKSYRDGISDVTGVNDSKWVMMPPRFEEPRKPGFVRVEIVPVASLSVEASKTQQGEGCQT